MGLFGFIHLNCIFCFNLYEKTILKKQLTMASLLKISLCDVAYVIPVCDDYVTSLNFHVQSFKYWIPKSSRPGKKRENVYLQWEKEKCEKTTMADFAWIRNHDKGSTTSREQQSTQHWRLGWQHSAAAVTNVLQIQWFRYRLDDIQWKVFPQKKKNVLDTFNQFLISIFG